MSSSGFDVDGPELFGWDLSVGVGVDSPRIQFGIFVLAVLVAAGTIWWWRSSRVEHPALGPLEVMGSRSWFKGDYTSRRRRLEAARPEGAESTDGSVLLGSTPVDLEAAALATPPRFDDPAEAGPLDGAGSGELRPSLDEHEVAGAAPSIAALDDWSDLAAIDEALSLPIDPLLRSQQRE